MAIYLALVHSDQLAFIAHFYFFWFYVILGSFLGPICGPNLESNFCPNLESMGPVLVLYCVLPTGK